MGIVKLIDRDGQSHELQALDGWRVMEILRDWGMFVPPRCAGSGEFGMCHVSVAEDWADKIPPAEEREMAMVKLIPVRTPTSRLSCQILWNETLDGLTVSLV